MVEKYAECDFDADPNWNSTNTKSNSKSNKTQKVSKPPCSTKISFDLQKYM